MLLFYVAFILAVHFEWPVALGVEHCYIYIQVPGNQQILDQSHSRSSVQHKSGA